MSTATATQLARLVAPAHARRGVPFDISVEVGAWPEPDDVEVEITVLEANGQQTKHKKRGTVNPGGEVSINFTISARSIGNALIDVEVTIGDLRQSFAETVDIY